MLFAVRFYKVYYLKDKQGCRTLSTRIQFIEPRPLVKVY